MLPFGVQKFRKLVLVGSFSAIIEFLMGFLASVLSGHLLGEDALAGMSLMSPVFTTIIFISGLFGVGMGVNYALEMGRCHKQKAHEIFSQGLWSVLIVGFSLAIILAFGHEQYLRFIGAEAKVAAHAAAYCRYFIPVVLLEPITVFLLNCCYADGDDKQCYIIYVAQIVANLGVSFIAIHFGMGTAGCALGSFAGFLLAVIIGLFHFRKRTNSFKLLRHFSLSDSFRIVKSSFGESSGFLCDSLLFILLSKVFVVKFGSEMLPVLSVVLATLGLLEIYNGVGSAVQPIVSVYVGEQNYKGARIVMRDAMKFSIAEGLGSMVLLLIFPVLAVKLVGITDPHQVRAAELAIRIISIGFVFTAVSNLLNGYYILIEREGLAVGFTFWKWFLAPMLCILAALPFKPMSAIWFAVGIGSPIGYFIFIGFLISQYGRKMCPLLLPCEREAKIKMLTLKLEESAIVSAAQSVAEELREAGVESARVIRAQLMTEEVLMAVKDRNVNKEVIAEVTLDLNEGVILTLRDDGEIFDITDANAKVNSLRTFLVASVMERQSAKCNLVTTGFNRNVFKF